MQKHAATQSVAQMSNYTDVLCGDSYLSSSDRSLRSLQFSVFTPGLQRNLATGGNKHIMSLRRRDYHDKSLAVPV